MPTKKRKVEVHRLTISGLPEGTAYGRFILDLRGVTRPVAEMVMKAGEKSHALNEAIIRNRRLRLRFLSYTKGHRPDVLDTVQFSLQPNPLTPDQTNVEWTHVLGGRKGSRYIMLVERNFNGIWPATLVRYLQWMVDEFYEQPTEDDVSDNEQDDREPITLSLEAEPGPEFLQRINALDRVVEATVRIVKPNPGWIDLDNELAVVAQQSDAHRAEVTMHARRRRSLKKRTGILEWIKTKFSNHELDYASVKGNRGRLVDEFNTAKLGKHSMLDLEIDDRDQIISESAWTKLSEMMDTIE